tara:strand:+ start:3018 stop:3335 length:318 start_codon:yes stop_codon:yes gene_type:complete
LIFINVKVKIDSKYIYNSQSPNNFFKFKTLNLKMFLSLLLTLLDFFGFNLTVKMLETFVAVDFQLVMLVSFMIFLLMLGPLFKLLKFMVLFPIFIFCLFGMYYLM